MQRFMSTLFSTVKYVSLPFSTAVPTVPVRSPQRGCETDIPPLTALTRLR